MVARNNAGLARHWLAKVRSVGLAFLLVMGIVGGLGLHAADTISPSSTASNAITVALTYQETDYSFTHWNCSLTTQTTPFKREPTLASEKSVRGILSFGNQASNAFYFIWQRDTGKLILDLNRNQDLTDDPAGEFTTPVSKQNYGQTFSGVHLPLANAGSQGQVLADLSFWAYSSRPRCSVAVRSFWQGKVTLSGQDWQVGILADEADQGASLANRQLLLRPWESRGQAFNTYGDAPEVFRFTKKLFLNGQAYQLASIARTEAGTNYLALEFTEQTVPLGELKITGQYIQRMILPGEPYLVLLDQPTNAVRIPLGNYHQPRIRLGKNGAAALAKANSLPAGGKISVTDKVPATLNVGGPLTNSVAVGRRGQELRLDYQLLGVGGEQYQLANDNRAHPPEFVISKGGKSIASGKFEFG